MGRFSTKGPRTIGLPLAILAAAALCAALPAAAAAGPHHHGGHVWQPSDHYPSQGWYGPRHAYPRHFGYGPVYYGHSYRYPYAPGFGFSIGNLPPFGYGYYDPYCGLPFASLDLYLDHLHAYGHPRRVRLIATDGGYPVGSYRYRGGRWAGCN